MLLQESQEFISYSKKTLPDLSSLRLLFIDTTIVKPDINEYITNKLLKPLGNARVQPAAEVVTPIITLSEHAGAILSFRDYLGPRKLEEFEQLYNQEDNTTTTKKKTMFATGRSRDVWECILDADALRRKKVVVLATSTSGDLTLDEPGCLKVGSHGFPFPKSTIAIVDPETTLFCPSDTLGEIWVDAPSLPDGFWGIPALTDAVYHAAPVLVPSETLYPETYDQQIHKNWSYGYNDWWTTHCAWSYEDSIRQQRLENELGVDEVHFSTDLINTLTKKTKVDSW